jgi:hypothetical protein
LKHFSVYCLDSGAKLLLSSELQSGWAEETQACIAAEAKLAEYKARFGKLE